MIKPLEYVSAIKAYTPGKPIGELERELGIKDCIKMASNENPLGPSPEALKALREFFQNGGGISRYPDDTGHDLKKAIIKKFFEEGVSISPEEIILGSGSNTMIDVAVRTFMGLGDEAVMATPSFVSYSLAVSAVGGICREAPLVDYRHNLKEMAEAISAKTKIVFVANPNNPTGTINRKDEFEKFMQMAPDGVLVVADEAYNEYVRDAGYPDALKYFRDKRDILVLRTFSKIYGLAGLRIGYGIARKDIIMEMDKIRGPFNTGTLSQLAAAKALSDKKHLQNTIEINELGKRYLYKELDLMGINYVPTEANFIYMPLEAESREVYGDLLRLGVIVRPVGPREIRVTIGLPEENKRFIEALKTVMNKICNVR